MSKSGIERGARAHACAALILSTLMAGCVNLQAVREFGDLSSSLTASNEIGVRWRDTEARLKAIPVDNEVPIKIQTGDRTKAYAQLAKISEVVATYLDVMGRLASDELVSVDEQAKALGKGLQELPGTPLSADRVEAIVKVTSLLSLPLDAYRHVKVRELIKEADPPLQRLLKGLQDVAQNIYLKDLAEERKAYSDWTMLYLASGKEVAANFLARRHVADQKKRYDDYEAAIKSYLDALKTIAGRHSELFVGLATKETLEHTIPKLKLAKIELIAARDQIRTAFSK